MKRKQKRKAGYQKTVAKRQRLQREYQILLETTQPDETYEIFEEESLTREEIDFDE